jgi:hypothetical protein
LLRVSGAKVFQRSIWGAPAKPASQTCKPDAQATLRAQNKKGRRIGSLSCKDF